MSYTSRSSIHILMMALLFAAAGCSSHRNKVLEKYNSYKFDSSVIAKLPVYDSLAMAILQKISILQQHIDKEDGYQAFRYMPASTETTVFKKIPEQAGTDIDKYLTRLGPGFIYGFDVFKDSSIKIYIRRHSAKDDPIDVEENLSYYPTGKGIRQREYPARDTALNNYWQYWTMFYKEGLF